MAYVKIQTGDRDLRLIDVVAKDPQHAFAYANSIICGRFAMGEEAIASDAAFSYHYAKYVLRKRFLLGEKSILTERFFANLYAEEVIKGPWPEAGIE